MSEKYKDLQDYPDVMSLKEVADYIHISKDTVRKACLTGELKHIRIGRLYKIPKEQLIEFFEKAKYGGEEK